jgi:hypothetical protein
MNQIAPPSLSRGGAQPPDDLDGLLRAFFQAELPRQWTAPTTPSVRLAPPPARKTPKGWPVLRTRLALAASVLILAAGALVLAGAFRGAGTGNGLAIKDLISEHKPLPGDPVPLPHETKIPQDVNLKDTLILGPDGVMRLNVDASYVPANPK